jgi:hypothetical protein
VTRGVVIGLATYSAGGCVSPILVRPVREQLEHDRLIRHLQGKYKRKFEISVNVGDERAAPVKIGSSTFYPDIVISDGRKLAGIVEVETGESVNNLEALAQWVHFSRVRAPFHLYVPVQGYDAARRLCESHGARVNEIWTYRPEVEGFDLVRMFVEPSAAERRAARAARSAGGGRTSRKTRSGGAKARKSTARAKSKRGAGPTKRTRVAAKARGTKAARPSKSTKTAGAVRARSASKKKVSRPSRPTARSKAAAKPKKKGASASGRKRNSGRRR